MIQGHVKAEVYIKDPSFFMEDFLITTKFAIFKRIIRLKGWLFQLNYANLLLIEH